MMDEFIALVETIIALVEQNFDELSEEEIQAANEFIQESMQFIQQSQSQQQQTQAAPPAQAEAPQVNHGNTPYPSSNINAFQYDPKTGQLMVKFMGQKQANAGPTYQYDGVPGYIFDILKRGAVAPKTSGKNRWHRWQKGVTPSHGAAMSALVKAGGFPYKKVA